MPHLLRWALMSGLLCAPALAQAQNALSPAAQAALATPGAPAQPEAEHSRLRLLRAGALLAVPGEAVRGQSTLVIGADGRITAIHPGWPEAATLGLPADTEVIDLKDQFVMPGFMDVHVHLTSGGIAGRIPDAALREEDGFFALNGARNAQATLMAGFTTVRDLGAPDGAIYPLRDAVRAGIVAGPHILAAGAGISPTNGHADVHGLRKALLAAADRGNTCNGADDCMRATREAIRAGADVIKVHVTGGVTDSSDTGTGQQFTDAELQAIAWTAHSMGRKVTTHAHGKEGIDAAVRAGYDSIEHAMWADEESLKAMKARGTWLVPTVWPIDWVGDTPDKVRKGPFRNLNENSMAKMLLLGDQPKKLARMAVRRGVPIALGTDSGISPHGTNGREMIEYVAAGMNPMEALKTGTVNAAAAMGLKDRGRIAPGMLADVIALGGDPIRDIAQVLNVRFVMRDGIIFKQSGIAQGE